MTDAGRPKNPSVTLFGPYPQFATIVHVYIRKAQIGVTNDSPSHTVVVRRCAGLPAVWLGAKMVCSGRAAILGPEKQSITLWPFAPQYPDWIQYPELCA